MGFSFEQNPPAPPNSSPSTEQADDSIEPALIFHTTSVVRQLTLVTTAERNGPGDRRTHSKPQL